MLLCWFWVCLMFAGLNVFGVFDFSFYFGGCMVGFWSLFVVPLFWCFSCIGMMVLFPGLIGSFRLFDLTLFGCGNCVLFVLIWFYFVIVVILGGLYLLWGLLYFVVLWFFRLYCLLLLLWDCWIWWKFCIVELLRIGWLFLVWVRLFWRAWLLCWGGTAVWVCCRGLSLGLCGLSYEFWVCWGLV